MKIRKLETTLVAVPVTRPPSVGIEETRPVGGMPTFGKHKIFDSEGKLKPQVSAIVEISTTDGLVGIGEASFRSPQMYEILKTLIDKTEPILLGRDPFDIERIRREIFESYFMTHLHPHVACWATIGVEMALWDLMGKVCQRPLCDLWGGAYRKEIPYMGWVVISDDVEDMKKQAKEYVIKGFKTLFSKVGFTSEIDERGIEAIRDAVGPDVEIRVDANQAWSTGEAIRRIKKLEKFDLEFVEQPVIMRNVDGLAYVRRSVNTPILAHESAWTFYDALEVIKKEAADALQLDPRFDYGFLAMKKAAGMAEAAGLPIGMHGWYVTGVSMGAFTNLLASIPNATIASQTHYYHLVDDVIKEDLLKFREGHLRVPEGPGIGVELDKDKFDKYAELYRTLNRSRYWC
ncbi:MAG: hypothetical protein GTN80_04070 [Nitrososphaeria archaeon]|nr:hypothetical protein [Nitrososphaeria archaeon]NIN52328.1 hypothetical protein [Nitrososphaeria archaeon]NIQ32806.1 hypothetical protein [Nitrososphaeria archaeon]